MPKETEPINRSDQQADFERLTVEQIEPTKLDEPLEVEESTEELARRVQEEIDKAWKVHDSFGKLPK